MSTPEREDKKGQKVADASSRYKALADNSIYKTMPDLDCAAYIADIWHEIGESKMGSMQIAPLDWVDLSSYSTFNSLEHWEASMIIQMSKQYVAYSNKGKQAGMQAPYCVDEELAIQQSREAMAAKNAERRRLHQLKNQHMKNNNLRDA